MAKKRQHLFPIYLGKSDRDRIVADYIRQMVDGGQNVNQFIKDILYVFATGTSPDTGLPARPLDLVGHDNPEIASSQPVANAQEIAAGLFGGMKQFAERE